MTNDRGPVQVLFPILLLLILIGSCSTSSTSIVTEKIPGTFAQLCATCHGIDLKGDIAQSLLDGSWQFGSRPNDIFRAIKFGFPQHGMPSWGAVLADDEIDTLVGYLLGEEARLAIPKPPLPATLETQDYQINVEVVAEGLERPWSIAFISSDRALITEQSGRLRILEKGVLLPDSILGISEVLGSGQGGLLDVVIDPAFDANGWIYLSISHKLTKKEGEERAPAMTSIVRGRIEENNWRDEQILFEAPRNTYLATGGHFGGRIVIDADGYLFFSIGDRDFPDHAQDLSLPNGKIHRIHTDGRIPLSNPFIDRAGVMPSIYSYGNRNAQGLAIHPQTGQLWSTEHGPMGGDELNLIRSGENYGWPVISYGINYNGELITDISRKEGMEQPILYWTPSIAVCELEFYSGDLFPKWKNRLLVGALKFEALQLLDIEQERVMYQQTILKNAGRVRDVTTGPDGAIYVLLNRPGILLRLTPELAI